MINIDSWPPEIALVVIGGPILLAFVSIAFSLYLGYRHLDDMLEALKNSRHIVYWADVLRHQGVFGRFMLVAKVSGVMVFPGPGRLIRAGELHPDDVQNFPAHLKRPLIAQTVLMVIILVWGALGCVLLKLK